MLSQRPGRSTQRDYLPTQKPAVPLEFRDDVTISPVRPSVGMRSAGHHPLRSSHWVIACRFGRGWVTDAFPPSMAGRFICHDWTGGGGRRLLRKPLLHYSVGTPSPAAQAS